jgi:hypothetical protein
MGTKAKRYRVRWIEKMEWQGKSIRIAWTSQPVTLELAKTIENDLAFEQGKIINDPVTSTD